MVKAPLTIPPNILVFNIYTLHISCLHISVKSIIQSESCLKNLANTYIHVALMGSSFDTKGMCSLHYKTCQDTISYITLLVTIFNCRDITQSFFRDTEWPSLQIFFLKCSLFYFISFSGLQQPAKDIKPDWGQR